MRIACVHQGYELYGSDRSFVDCVAALRAAFPEAEIEAVLPRSGPIVPALRPYADSIAIEPVWVLRRQSMARLLTLGLARLVPAVVRAVLRFRRSDLVYINTCVVADHALAARFFRGRALLHIHEIPEGATRRLLGGLVRWSRAAIVFNSRATAATFRLPPGMRSQVIYNGIAGPAMPEPQTYDGTRPLRVLLLGRINRIKGQEVLLEALRLLPPALRPRVAVRMAGGAFESAERERALSDLMRQMGLEAQVSVEPFLPDPSPLYRWADIVAVPSRRPESLGRVAIEAMAFGRPPLASAIGGLVEVVEDGRSGWLVPPDDAPALAARLAAIIRHPRDWAGFPAAGRARYEALFSEGAAARAIAAAADELLHPGPAASAAPTIASAADAS